MTEAVLLMMHQGNSFTQEVSEILKKKGLALLALSSRPPKPETFEKQQEFLADWIVVDRPQLELDDAVGAVATFAERAPLPLVGEDASESRPQAGLNRRHKGAS